MNFFIWSILKLYIYIWLSSLIVNVLLIFLYKINSYEIRVSWVYVHFEFSLVSDEQKIYCQSCGTNLDLKSQSKLSRHSYDRLVKISDQNTQGVTRSKS